jgi:predicted DNA binding CopG/RHH family protein
MSKVKNTKHVGYDAPYFDDEEREIMEALKRGEYKSAPNLPERIKELKRAAANTLKKKPITVRVQQQDIERIKVKALEQGIPYQTLVSSILHRYASGTLKEEA